jgi:predicted transcriptional regulator
MERAMKVRDAMHGKVEWAQPTETVQSLAKRMRQLDIGSIPIGENDRLIGMVTDRDIAVRAVADGRDPSQLTAREVMSEGIASTAATMRTSKMPCASWSRSRSGAFR